MGQHRVEARVDSCFMTWGYSMELRKRAFILPRPADWTAPPLTGEHTRDVLHYWLDLSDDELNGVGGTTT